MLEKSFKYQLKSQAHSLKPVVLLGTKGLTQAVMDEIEQVLLVNELIKIKLAGIERDDRKNVVQTICQSVNAHFIQVIGQVATIYRKMQDN